MWIRASLQVAALTIAQSSAAPPPLDPPPMHDRSALVQELAAVMLAGIDTHAPSAHVLGAQLDDRPAAPSIFRGSYDWHSCVFAHWSLLVIARTTGDGELSAKVADRLAPRALRTELALLRDLPPGRNRVTPYDRGWLLRLLAELPAHRPEDREALGALQRDLESELLDWLEAQPFPENAGDDADPRRPPYVGFYQSWLWAWLQVRTAGATSAEREAQLTRLFEARIAPLRRELAERVDWIGYDFLWIPSLRVLAEDLMPAAREPLPFLSGDPIPIPDELHTGNVHPLGIAISRLWGHATLAAGGDPAAAAAFDERLRHFVERPELWRGDFAAVSHWIPQFLFLACWLRDGRP